MKVIITIDEDVVRFKSFMTTHTASARDASGKGNAIGTSGSEKVL